MAYLIMLSVAQIMQRGMVGQLLNIYLEMTWKNTVVAEFEVFSRHMPGVTE
jgi:hypothetical protein